MGRHDRVGRKCLLAWVADQGVRKIAGADLTEGKAMKVGQWVGRASWADLTVTVGLVEVVVQVVGIL